METLCGGSSLSPDAWLRIAGELWEANAEVRMRLDRNSPWLEPQWIEDVERLEEIGLSIAFACRNDPARDEAGAGAAGHEVASLSHRFKTLLQTLRAP